MKKIQLLFILAMISLEAISFAKIKNLGNPLDSIYRGGWLHNQEKDFEDLKKKGVDTIINLEVRSDNDELCSKYKMNCVHHPMMLIPWLDILQKEKTIIKAYWHIINLIDEGHTVYIHCLMGSDRTGLLVAALMLKNMMEQNNHVITQKELTEIFEELYTHKYHFMFFPGIESKILKWIIKTPKWLFKNPFKRTK